MKEKAIVAQSLNVMLLWNLKAMDQLKVMIVENTTNETSHLDFM